MQMTELGWSETLARHFAPYRAEGYAAGRITLEQKNLFVAATDEYGEIPAVVTGRLQYEALTRADLPVVGDWVALRIPASTTPQAAIHAVLPRVSLFSRTAAGNSGDRQPVAANIDLAFLLTGLDGNFNLRRIERYLLQARESRATPVLVLTKADLCRDVDACLSAVAAVAGDAPVHAISTHTSSGLAALTSHLQPGITVALLGSSGVGKSTLLNTLLGTEVMRTRAVRVTDSRGRHTTSHRQLFLLPSGAALIDTPGMRELRLWADEDGLPETFPEIEALAGGCRFPDCRHDAEPGCAVLAALASGALDPGRLDSYRKMQRELHFLAAKTNWQEEQQIARKWKQISKAAKQLKKERGR